VRRFERHEIRPMRYQPYVLRRGRFIYTKHGSMILAVQKFWQTELAVKIILIVTVGKKWNVANIRRE